MKVDKTPTLPRTANPADRASIAAILADTQDDPMCNKAVRVAHEVLRQVAGAAFEARPFMLTGLAPNHTVRMALSSRRPVSQTVHRRPWSSTAVVTTSTA